METFVTFANQAVNAYKLIKSDWDAWYSGKKNNEK